MLLSCIAQLRVAASLMDAMVTSAGVVLSLSDVFRSDVVKLSNRPEYRESYIDVDFYCQ